jgi:hypothetical protein
VHALLPLISLVAIETRATVANLLRALNDLTKLMEDSKLDIKAFNTGVNAILIGLRARRASIPDIVTNLFTAYKNCADAVFVAYIDRKEEAYEDRSLDIDAPTLMHLALEKYKVIEGKGQWMQKTEQELKFIAMEAQLQANVSSKKKTLPTDGSGKKQGKQVKTGNDDKWAWKTVIKPGDEKKEKTFEGKVYVHCPYHGTTKWVLKVNREGNVHKDKCTKDPKNTASLSVKPPKTEPTAEQITYAKALATVMTNEGNETDGEEDS